MPIQNLLLLGAASPALVDHLVLIQARRGHHGHDVRHRHRVLAFRTKRGLRKRLVLRNQVAPPLHSRDSTGHPSYEKGGSRAVHYATKTPPKIPESGASAARNDGAAGNEKAPG